MKFNSKRGIWF